MVGNNTGGKYDKEASLFKEYFGGFSNCKIAIYGIGRRTLTLLPRIDEFNVVGLLDRDTSNLGKVINGIEVISIEAAKEKADIIIINSDPSNYRAIYKRIYDCGIDVYYSNGEKADAEDILEIEKNNDALWKRSLADIKDLIEKYDVISFDVFDTLLERNLLTPSDVFGLLEKKYGTNEGVDSIKHIRQEAVGCCDIDDPSIDDIYNQMLKRSDLSQDTINRIKKDELAIENKVIVPRREFIDLLDYAADSGKIIILVSDMYLRRDDIYHLLKKYTNKVSLDNIFVSCEFKKNKKDGTLWSIVAEHTKGKRVLHIGDEFVGDCEQPSKHGIDSVCIDKKNDLLEMSVFSELVSHAKSLEDCVALGMVRNKLFDDHYGINCKQREIIVDASQLGYCVFGPIILYYFICLINEMKESQNSRIIFLARDGFFLYKDYEVLRDLLERYQREKLPESCYLPISRRAVLVASYTDKEAWEELLRIPFSGTFQEFLLKRFNVQTDDRTRLINNTTWENGTIEQIENLISPYEDEIKRELETEKQSYINYLSNNQFFDDSEDYLMDLGCQGTNQYYLQKITNKKYKGRYFYANLDSDNSFLRECDIKAIFQKEDDLKGERSSIRTQSAYLESFFTAPYGMLRYITSFGDFVYEDKKRNQKEFSTKEEINAAALEFISDYLRIFEKLEKGIGLELIDSVYEAFFSGKCRFIEDVQNSFYFDNDMIGSAEQRLIGD